jgi:hypothetical protein
MAAWPTIPDDPRCNGRPLRADHRTPSSGTAQFSRHSTQSRVDVTEQKNTRNAVNSAGPPLSDSGNSASGTPKNSIAAAAVTIVPTQLIPVNKRAFPGLISSPLRRPMVDHKTSSHSLRAATWRRTHSPTLYRGRSPQVTPQAINSRRFAEIATGKPTPIRCKSSTRLRNPSMPRTPNKRRKRSLSTPGSRHNPHSPPSSVLLCASVFQNPSLLDTQTHSVNTEAQRSQSSNAEMCPRVPAGIRRRPCSPFAAALSPPDWQPSFSTCFPDRTAPCLDCQVQLSRGWLLFLQESGFLQSTEPLI